MQGVPAFVDRATAGPRVALGSTATETIPDRQHSSLGAKAQTIGIGACGLMLWAGQIKEIPPLPSLPVDFTLGMTAVALICGVVFGLATSSSVRRDPLLVTVILFTIGLLGALSYVASDYATDKTLRFFLVTWPSTAAIAALVRDERDVARLLKAVVGVAFGLSVYIAFAGEREYDAALGRLTSPDGGTIMFGQACGAVVVAVAAWLLTSNRLTPGALALGGAVVGYEVWTMLAIASKGPIQAVVLAAFAIMMLQLRRLNRRSSMRIAGSVVVGFVAFIAVWSRVPLWSRERLLEFSSGNSAGSRIRAWSFTWSELSASPFGRGWGSWEEASPVHIGHPHNIVLEFWYEAGLLGLILLLAAIGLAVTRLVMLFDTNRQLATLGLGLVAFWFAAAQVSSDINGNKLLFGMLAAAVASVAVRPAVPGTSL